MITIPKLKEIYDGLIADIQNEFDITLPTVGKNYLRSFAAVTAAKLKLFYLALGNIQKNVAPDTADSESNGGTLERFGRIKLGRNPFPPRAGQYVVTVTGTIGAIIPASQTFKSNDDSLNPGKLFILDVEYELVNTTDTITVRALESGVDSKLNIGDRLTATSPIALVNSIVIVDSELIQPLAAETIEDYREKVLDSYRLEAQGGAATDYRLWSADAQGVERVYPYAKSGESNVIELYVEATTIDSTDGKGTPSAGLLNEVESVIEFNPDTSLDLYERGRRPLGVFRVDYLPITPLDIDIVINDFDGLTGDIQTAIENAIEAYVNNIRPFVSAADILDNKNDIISVYGIVNAILNVRPGSQFGTVTLEVDSVPVSSYTFTFGDIPYVNSITFV